VTRSLADIAIRPMTVADWPDVERIYAAGIATGNATFEHAPPSWEHFDETMSPDLRFVAVLDDRVVGWVAASPVSDRCVYSGVVEHSVYVSPDYRGQGIARQLLEKLIASAEAAGIWTLQSGVFPENTASLAVHERAGFRIVGTRQRLGQHHGRWRDVVFIERRSPVVGGS
jgi:phosphinothricin acetyltransferase